MKNYLKKILFVFAGLLFIGGGFFFGQPGKVDAASKEEKKKFGNWSLNCSVDDKKKQTCFLSQQINNTIKGKEQEVLARHCLKTIDKVIKSFKKDKYINRKF